jgi:Cysteine rich repeat
MSIRNAAVSIAVALFAAALASGAYAQEKAPKGRGPCAEDAKKFCGDVEPGGGRIAKCMKSHEADLSPACQDQIKAAKQRVEQVREECKGDAEKFCKDVKPGGGRMLECLKSHQAELAPGCAAEFNRKK